MWCVCEEEGERENMWCVSARKREREREKQIGLGVENVVDSSLANRVT